MPNEALNVANGMRNSKARAFMQSNQSDVFFIHADSKASGQKFIVLKNKSTRNIETLQSYDNPYFRGRLVEGKVSPAETNGIDIKVTAAGTSTAFKTALVTVKILGVIGVAASVYNVATAKDKGQAVAREATGWAGAWIGGKVFGTAGAGIAGPWGGLIGGVIGGALGYFGATSMFDGGPSGGVIHGPVPTVDKTRNVIPYQRWQIGQQN